MQFNGQLHEGLDDDIDEMLVTNVKYVNPEIILEDDNIAIMGCNSKYVWFSITDHEVSKA